jgi:cytochrome c556
VYLFQGRILDFDRRSAGRKNVRSAIFVANTKEGGSMNRALRYQALAIVALATGVILAQERAPSIKEIMARLNKPGGLYPTLSKELKSETVDWDEVRQQMHSFAKFAAELSKNSPPKGDPGSWNRLANQYAENARLAEQAAAKKDRGATKAALSRLGGTACETCHAEHRKK